MKIKIVNLKKGKNCKIIEPVNIYGATLGNSVFIGPFVEIQKNVTLGAKCKTSSHTFICEGVAIGNDVFIGHDVMFTSNKYP